MAKKKQRPEMRKLAKLLNEFEELVHDGAFYEGFSINNSGDEATLDEDIRKARKALLDYIESLLPQHSLVPRAVEDML